MTSWLAAPVPMLRLLSCRLPRHRTRSPAWAALRRYHWPSATPPPAAARSLLWTAASAAQPPQKVDSRLRVIKLVRHGESEANVGRMSAQRCGDPSIPLSPLGHQQALQAGTRLGADFLRRSLVFCSPYQRTRETLAGILQGSGLSSEDTQRIKKYEDPRLREVEFGYEDLAAQEARRRTHGWFYYRFEGGESPADCYDRTSAFLESMMREIERRNKEDRVLIVSHGLTLRCFVMRFLHLSTEQFDAMQNPGNCDILTIARTAELSAQERAAVVFTSQSGRWGVTGITLCDRGSNTAASATATTAPETTAGS